MTTWKIEEEGRPARLVTGLYPGSAATNYVAVVAPGALGVRRTLVVRAWPFSFLRAKMVFSVVAGRGCARARQISGPSWEP